MSNGKGVGVALFVQGCNFHCKNCFNPETWDFYGGKEWTEEVKNKFLELANRPYIKRISILGGEPLAEENINDVLDLVNEIRLSRSQKSIWLYTGYQWKHIFDTKKLSTERWKRQQIVSQCNVLVDGKYEETQRDITLKWCGSRNQNVIDVKKTIQKGEIVLWKD